MWRGCSQAGRRRVCPAGSGRDAAGRACGCGRCGVGGAQRRRGYLPRFRPGATADDIYAAVVTDWFFRIPAIRVAEAREGSPTWIYQFIWKSPVRGGNLGSCHYLEAPFVFDTLKSEGAGSLAGSQPPQNLAHDMHQVWVSFATTGVAGWPRYDPAMRTTILFGTHSEVVHDPRGDERQHWDGIR
jgi:para-nitrobenzyl esterase